MQAFRLEKNFLLKYVYIRKNLGNYDYSLSL